MPLPVRDLNAELFHYMSTENFQHDAIDFMVNNSTMTETAKILEKVQQRLIEKNMTAREASMAATGKPDLIITLKKGHMPSGSRVAALERVLGFEAGSLLSDQGSSPPSALNDAGFGFRAFELPRDVPVYGTAMGANFQPDENGHGKPIESTEIDLFDHSDFVRRPPALDGRKDAYALYIVGVSMMPRFEPGDLIYIDPRRPPAIGDDVIVQIRRDVAQGDDRHEIETGLIKKLVRRSASFIELEQHNPPAQFRLETTRVARMQRVMRMVDLMTF